GHELSPSPQPPPLHDPSGNGLCGVEIANHMPYGVGANSKTDASIELVMRILLVSQKAQAPTQQAEYCGSTRQIPLAAHLTDGDFSPARQRRTDGEHEKISHPMLERAKSISPSRDPSAPSFVTDIRAVASTQAPYASSNPARNLSSVLIDPTSKSPL